MAVTAGVALATNDSGRPGLFLAPGHMRPCDAGCLRCFSRARFPDEFFSTWRVSLVSRVNFFQFGASCLFRNQFFSTGEVDAIQVFYSRIRDEPPQRP
jgi:hypothetical protein